MKFIYKNVGCAPETLEQDEIRLADLQHYTEGSIEAPYVPGLNEAGITLWANEEGLLVGMKPNLIIEMPAQLYEPMVIVGPAVFTGTNRAGDTAGLTEDQQGIVKSFIQEHVATADKFLRLRMRR